RLVFVCYVAHPALHSCPTRRSSDLGWPARLPKPSRAAPPCSQVAGTMCDVSISNLQCWSISHPTAPWPGRRSSARSCHWWWCRRTEEHTSQLQTREKLVCRLLLEKK